MIIPRIVGDEIELRFPYDVDLIGEVKLLPGRKWDATRKIWTLKNCQTVRSHLKKLGIVMPDTPLLQEEDVRPLFSTTKPFAHQERITKILVHSYEHGRRGVAVFAETGTGKTKPVIDFMENIQMPTLVVCPAPLVNVWRDELVRHVPFATPYFCHGPKRIPGAWDETQWNVTSYGTAVNDLHDWLINPPEILVLDESQCIKNNGSQRSKAMRRLAKKCRFVVLMTGTPMPNGYSDLWPQLYAMDPDLLGDRNTFLSAYCEFGGYEDKEIVGYRNLPLLHEIMRRSCIVVKKSECLDLPPKVYQTIDLTPTKEQVKRSRLAMQGVCGEEPLTCTLTRIQKMRQIASGFVYQKEYTEEGEVDEVVVEEFETPKRDFLMEASFGLPTIIWTNYVREITDISSILTEKGVSFSISDGRHDAYEEAMRFERGEVQVLLAQMQSIQYGFTLNRVAEVVYYSGSYDAMQRQQTEDRCHRVGQTKSVRYRTLVCGDIEKIMLEAVLAKIDVQDACLNYIKEQK